MTATNAVPDVRVEKTDPHGGYAIHVQWHDKLPAPNGMAYLPCDGPCGRLLTVKPNVVSACCSDCLPGGIVETSRAPRAE